MALLVPAAVALDILLLALGARFFPLEAVVLASRPLWLIATGAAFVLQKRPRPSWPNELREGGWKVPLAATVTATALSVLISRSYAIWDRWWHIPLVKTISTQRIPFQNVYYGTPLRYHFAGDVLASALQTLSWDRINSSLALTLAHDISFALTGLCFGLLLRLARTKTVTAALAATVALVLAGPVTILREGTTIHDHGHSTHNYLTLSFRPHVSLAGVLMVGFLAASIVRLWAPVRPKLTLAILFATATALSLTDEASIGVMGLALGAAWLVQPDLIHPKRLWGLVFLVGLGAVLVGANVFFHAALTEKNGPGSVALVAPRMPGYWEGPMPLSFPKGPALLVQDLLLFGGVWIGGLVAALAVRRRAPSILFAFYTALLVVSVFCFLCVELHKSPVECHRFVTAAFLFSPIFSVLFLASLDAAHVSGELRALASFFILGANGLVVASGLTWIVSIAPRVAETHQAMLGAGDLYAVDCRKQAGASLLSPVRPTYIEASIWYMYAGCRPVVAPGKIDPGWGMGVRDPVVDVAAFVELDDKIARRDEPIVLACNRRPAGAPDRVCALAEKQGLCKAISADVSECSVSQQSRPAILSALGGR
jgi:hypothetical protein